MALSTLVIPAAASAIANAPEILTFEFLLTIIINMRKEFLTWIPEIFSQAFNLSYGLKITHDRQKWGHMYMESIQSWGLWSI